MKEENNIFEKLVSSFNNKTYLAIKKMDQIFRYQKYLFIYIIVIAIFIYLFYKFGFFTIFSYDVFRFDYLFLFLLLTFLQILILTIRFSVFLKTSFSFNQIGYFLGGLSATYGIPPKPLGEAMRLLVLKYYYKTKYHSTLLTIILEAIFDMSLTVIIGLIGAVLLPFPSIMDRILLTLLAVVLGILFVIVFYYFIRNLNLKIKNENVVFIFLNHIFELSLKYIKNISLFSFKTLFFSFFLSILRILIVTFRMYLIFLMFGLEINFFVVVGLWALCEVIGVASLLPGGVGAYELSFVYLSGILGIEESLAFGVIIVERLFNYWLPLFIGLTILFFSKKPLAEMKKEFFKHVEIQISNLFKVYLKTTDIAKKIKEDAKKIKEDLAIKKLTKNKKK